MICPTCSGSGKVSNPHPALRGLWPCMTCDGKGIVTNKVKKTPWKGISIEVRK